MRKIDRERAREREREREERDRDRGEKDEEYKESGSRWRPSDIVREAG